MPGNYAIFGLGPFGVKLAQELTRSGSRVVAVDIDPERVGEIKDKVDQSIIADVSSQETIRELAVAKFDAVVLGMSSHFESQILALTLLKQEGAQKVIAKTNSPIQKRILLRLGADEIIQPDQDIAERLALQLSMSSITDLFEFKGSAIAEVMIPGAFVGQTLRRLDLRNKHNITVLLIKKPGRSSESVWDADTVLEADDQMTVFGKPQAIMELFKA